MAKHYNLISYTEERVRYNPYTPATWITATELLELLNRVEDGNKAIAKLAAIKAEEEIPSDLMEEHPVDELDYGDLEPGQDILNERLQHAHQN